ncbi:MAG: transcription elongation factor GreA [bacterium]
MSETIRMSKEGLAKLEAELRRLKFEERPKIVAEIDRARQLGDLSENAEYHAAKEAQGHLERKIVEMQERLARVQMVDTDAIPTDKVYLYAKVLVKDQLHDEEIEYTITPPDEADVDNDIISIDSPVAKAMLGKAVGEVVQIPVPAGTLTYEILKISR